MTKPVPEPVTPRPHPIESLFRTHYAGLCDLVYRYVRSRDLASELVQDLFLKVWQRSISGGSVEEASAAYLYASARNRALQHLRRLRVEAKWEDRVALQPPRLAAGSDEELAEGELAAAIAEAIAELPERSRVVFSLSRYDQLSNAEIAQRLGITVSTVEQHMWRALKTLRVRLAPYLSVFVTASVSGLARVLQA